MNIEEMRKDKKKKLVGIPVVGEIVRFDSAIIGD